MIRVLDKAAYVIALLAFSALAALAFLGLLLVIDTVTRAAAALIVGDGS